MSDILLELEGVHTHIGPYHILHGVDCAIPAGGLTVLLGRNGAGKTTTLRTIMGLWQASSGSIRFDGLDISKVATPDIARAGIAYVPESMAIFTDLTVRENIVLAARRGPVEADRLEWILGSVSRPQAVLESAGRQSLRRAEADARHCARDRGTTPAAARG